MKKLLATITTKTNIFALSTVLLVSMVSCNNDNMGTGEEKPLNLQVITASPEGFQINATLLTGEKDAILIDAQFTLNDAQAVVNQIKESKKNLTTVYITHSHPDHYFGLEVIKKAFPNAKIIALPATVADIQATLQDKLNTWKPLYGDKITSNPVIPEVYNSNTLMLEGKTIQLIGNVQGDEKNNTYVWVPSIKAVIGGDIIYNNAHPWTTETTSAERLQWIKTLDQIAALNPNIVVAGHKKLLAPDNAASLEFTKKYLLFFNNALATSTNATEFKSKINTEFPNLEIEISLQIAAKKYFPN